MRSKRPKSKAEIPANGPDAAGRQGLVAERLDPALIELQIQVARLMLEAGVDVPTMQEQMQRAIVLAASSVSRFRNKKPNYSGIAAMTGLPRNEIRKILEDAESKDQSFSAHDLRGMDRLVGGWLSDQEFLGPKGEPLVLPRGGGPGSFESLVSRYGSDVPAAALLRELMRRNIAELREERVTLTSTRGRTNRGPTAKKLAQTFRPLVEEVVAAGDKFIGIGSDSVVIEIQDDMSYSLLKRHLEVAVPLFFEQARIAANGIIGRKSGRTGSRKSRYVRLDLISINKK